MSHDSATSDQVGGLVGSQNGVFEQSPSQTFSFLGNIYRESCEEGNGYRIPAQSLRHTSGNLIAAHGPVGKGVVAGDPIPMHRHVGSRRAVLVIQQRISAKVTV
jgi:hypothetical protein